MRNFASEQNYLVYFLESLMCMCVYSLYMMIKMYFPV